jgi:hypothetical protein
MLDALNIEYSGSPAGTDGIRLIAVERGYPGPLRN